MWPYGWSWWVMLIALSLAGLGWGQNARGDPLYDKLRVHMVWIAENSRFEVSAELPEVKRLTPEEWRTFAKPDQVAIYEEGTIFVPSWKRTSDDTWVHELTHHYQWLAGELTAESCAGDFEMEAYDIEKKWTETFGVQYNGLGPLVIIQKEALCRENRVHPL